MFSIPVALHEHKFPLVKPQTLFITNKIPKVHTTISSTTNDSQKVSISN